MSNNPSIINIFTYKLPGHLARPMYSEYNNRYSEALRLIDNYAQYSSLKEHLDTVELLLALSIFYKHVVANLDAATKFYGLVVRRQRAESVRIGSYELNAEEILKIDSLITRFQRITTKYNIYDTLWNYSLTLDFLKRLVDLLRQNNG